MRKTQRERLSWEAELQLKTLLREYLEEKSAPTPTTRYDFLPNFGVGGHSLPVSVEKVPWSRNDELDRTIRFERREDLQDFVNCYLELEEEMGIYTTLTVKGLQVSVKSETSLDSRFRNMIEEIASETRGY